MKDLERMLAQATSGADYARRYVAYVADLLARTDFHVLERIARTLELACRDGRAIFVMGNGGSASTSAHFVNDLLIGARVEGEAPFRAVSLTDNVANLTALGNDQGFDQIFVGQLEPLFRPGDALVVFSASGNSPNLVKAVEFANERGGTTVAMLGFDGGKLRSLCGLSLVVATPRGEYGPVESIHATLSHALAAYLRGCVLERRSSARRGE